MTIRVGLFGFGKAGRAVATTLLNSKETWLSWVARRSSRLEHRSVPEYIGIESEEPGTIVCVSPEKVGSLLDEQPVEVIVDFSSPHGIEAYGAAAAERGIAIVSAISSYEEHHVQLLHSLSKRIPILWSPNITVGINFLMLAAKLLRQIAPSTDVEILEEHFRAKPEVSGTAKAIARELGIPSQDIKSIRAGGIIGRHEILFGFPYQTVRLIHESISREAFGNGAIFAVKQLMGKQAGLYAMEDLLRPFLGVQQQLG